MEYGNYIAEINLIMFGLVNRSFLQGITVFRVTFSLVVSAGGKERSKSCGISRVSQWDGLINEVPSVLQWGGVSWACIPQSAYISFPSIDGCVNERSAELMSSTTIDCSALTTSDTVSSNNRE